MGITNKDVLKTVLKVPQLEEQLESNAQQVLSNEAIMKQNACDSQNIFNLFGDNVYNPNMYLAIKKAILSGKLKIAFWGDSITEGIDTLNLQNSYVERVIKKLKEVLPSTTIEYVNYSIMGKGLASAINDNYVGGASDTSTTFKRPWSVTGKSWKQHIADYQPDLVVLAFGMNDNGLENWVGEWNYTNLATCYNFIKSISSSPDTILVSTMLPNIELSNYSREIVNSVAKSYRIFAKENNLYLVDVNRISNFVFYGEDIENQYLEVSRDLTQNILNYLLDYDVTLASGESFTVLYRKQKTTNSYFEMKFTNNNNTTMSVYLKFIERSAGYAIASANIAFSNNLKIKHYVNDNNHKLVVNGVEIFNQSTMKGITAGAIELSGGTQNSCTTWNWKNIKTNGKVSVDRILGNLNPPIGGNALNHPTGIGTIMLYYQGFLSLFDNIGKFKTFTRTVDIATWSIANASYPTPTNKKLLYKTLDKYDKFQGCNLEFGGVVKQLNKFINQNADLPNLKDNEFAIIPFGQTQNIVFVSVDDANASYQTPSKFYYSI